MLNTNQLLKTSQLNPRLSLAISEIRFKDKLGEKAFNLHEKIYEGKSIADKLSARGTTISFMEYNPGFNLVEYFEGILFAKEGAINE